MQRKLRWFVLYSIAFTAAVMHVDNLHQALRNQSAANVLQYNVLNSSSIDQRM